MGKLRKPPWLQDAEKVAGSSDSWIVPTRDAQGHHSRVWLNVPPLMKDLLSKIKDEKQFPYRSTGAVIRHALLRHAKWLARQIDECTFKSTIVQIDTIADIMRDEDFQADFMMVFEMISKSVTRHVSDGNYDQAQFVLLRAYNEIKKLPEGFWKTRYVTEFNNKFSHIMNRNKEKVSPERSADLVNFSNE